jgi:hypothetical protein
MGASEWSEEPLSGHNGSSVVFWTFAQAGREEL